MMKRILISGVAAVVVAGVLLLLLLKKSDTQDAAFVSEAVPDDALLFFEKLDYTYLTGEFIETSSLWKEFVQYPYFASLDSQLISTRELVRRMPLVQEKASNGALSLSLHLLGKEHIAAIFFLDLGEDVNDQTIEQEMISAMGNDAILNERKYEAEDLVDVSLPGNTGKGSFSYAITNGILMFSSSTLLLENAIRTLHSGGGIYSKEGFRKVAATAGKYVYGNVYLNYPQLYKLFYPAVNDSYKNRLNVLGELADWGEFDIDYRDNEIVMTGMTSTSDSTGGWLHIFKGQDPVRIEAVNFVPSNAIKLLALGISDKDLIKKAFTNEIRRRDEFMSMQASFQEFINVIGVNPLFELIDLLNDEIVSFTLENSASGVYEDVVAWEVKSRSEAMEVLSHWITVYAAESGKAEEDFMYDYQLDQQSKYTIYTLPVDWFKGSILENFIKSSFAFYDNYIVFSDSQEAISRTIYQNVLHKTFANEALYEEISNLISSRANYTFLVKPVSCLNMLLDELDPELAEKVKLMAPSIFKVPGMVLQYSTEGDMLYSNLSLKYTAIVKEKATTVWESLLDSMAIIKPVLVLNHYTSEKEILVQDATNTLSLLNSTGRILWKVRLDSPVMSEIYQIDFYNNGKLQYLFNTKNSIHLIDRNGNNVERYPVKLRADATNGMSLFDYDKRRDYRLFIACADRKVYAYDISGNIIPGWKFKRTEGTVRNPVQHFRIHEKDYIIFADNVRTYILNRKGNERVDIDEQYPVSPNNSFYLDMNISNDRPRFMSTDTSGNVIAIALDGESTLIMEHAATIDHFFRIKDMDHDGNPECLYADGNELELIDLNNKRIFSLKIKSDIASLPDIYEFSSTDLKIGITDEDKNQIYLVNSDGSLYEGFPLEGNTRFSIGYFAGSDSRFNLLVGSRNGFLYNYSIE